MNVHDHALVVEQERVENASAVLLTFVVPDEILNQLMLIDPAPAIQSHRFGLRLIDIMSGLADKLECISTTPVQDYPIVKKMVFNGYKFSYDRVQCFGVPFINIVVLKHLTRFFALLMQRRRLFSTDILLVHGLHLPYLVISILAKRFGVRIGIVLTDQQGIILPTDGPVRVKLKKIDRWLAVKLARQFDFVIALSNSLRDTYSSKDQAMVIPGVFDNSLSLSVRTIQRDKSQKFRVLYFGGLYEDYGIQMLMDAAALVDDEIEIRLFGSGPMVDVIRSSPLRHRNIFWGGLVDQSVLIQEMANCDLLINPRPSSGVMASFSSPSKLLEYAAAGKPVLTTRLPSLPSALVEAALVIEEETPRGIANSILYAAARPADELRRLGEHFQKVVIDICSVEAITDKLRYLALKR